SENRTRLPWARDSPEAVSMDVQAYGRSTVVPAPACRLVPGTQRHVRECRLGSGGEARTGFADVGLQAATDGAGDELGGLDRCGQVDAGVEPLGVQHVHEV